MKKNLRKKVIHKIYVKGDSMKPLEGIKIVDFTIAHAGTLSTMLLADQGAEVIKVENVENGELGRTFAPENEKGSGYFAFLNRNKKGIAVDMSSEEGKDILLKLIADADVVTENFTYGIMDKCGLGYENLKKINPKIVYASLSGYGRTGPRKKMRALEVQMQSMSGISSISGYPDQAPTRAGTELACHVGGTYLSIAIMIAVISAKKTGIGQRIDVSIVDGVLSMIEAAPIEYTLNGTERERTGNSYPSICPYDTFDTRDGSISVGVSTDRQWGLLCQALGMEELIEDPRYKTNETRGSNYWSGLRDTIQDKLLTMSRFEVERAMRENKIPCGIVYEISEAMESDPVAERKMLIDVEDHTMGNVKMPGIAIKYQNEEENTPAGAPAHGEHTYMYLKELGYSDDEIKELAEKHIVKIDQ